ncbi:hypothetical protein [Microbacterium sp.]|uniref:hypothetical protein n=1 Tax=Microbacterium sp. TaxID=51671 RepID=UPI0039E297C5
METVRTASIPPQAETSRAAYAPRWFHVALCAVGLALGWMVLSTATGWGAEPSHADDDDRPGLLGSVTGLVEGTVDILPDPLEEVVEKPVVAVTSTAAKTVEKTTEKATEVISKSTTKVADAKPATTVTKTVTKAVSKTPVVGAVVDELGADDLVDHVGGVVDDVLADAGHAVDTVVEIVVDGGPTVVLPATPLPETPGEAGPSPEEPATSPGADAVPSSGDTSLAGESTPVDAAFWAAITAASASSRDSVATVDGARTAPRATRADAPAAPPGTPALLPAQVCAALGLSSGSSGTATGPGALPASAPSYARHAWSCIVGHGGWIAPASPASSPDTSPD